MEHEVEVSQQFTEVVARILLLETQGKYQEAIEECRRYLREGEITSDLESSFVEYKCAVLSRLTDPNYTPPPYYHPEDYEPLELQSRAAARRRDYAEALMKAWDYMRYLSIGSYPVQRALAAVAEYALKVYEEDLAKAAAHLWVAHLQFMDAASRSFMTPIDPYTPREKWRPPREPIVNAVFTAPEETALRFILEEDHPDWATILEMAADAAARPIPPELHPSPHLLRVLKALVQHYRKFGKQEALQALLQKYPEAQRFLQEGEE